MAQYLSFSNYRHNSNKSEKSCFAGSQPSPNPRVQRWQYGMFFTIPLPAHPSQGLKGMATLLGGGDFSVSPTAMSGGAQSLAGAVQGSPVPLGAEL